MNTMKYIMKKCLWRTIKMSEKNITKKQLTPEEYQKKLEERREKYNKRYRENEKFREQVKKEL